MFFLSTGFLRRTIEEGKSKSPGSKVECNQLVMVEEIKLYDDKKTVLLLLNYVKHSLFVFIDYLKFKKYFKIDSSLNDCADTIELENGSVIFIYEYCFSDIALPDRKNSFNLMCLLEFSIIGKFHDSQTANSISSFAIENNYLKKRQAKNNEQVFSKNNTSIKLNISDLDQSITNMDWYLEATLFKKYVVDNNGSSVLTLQFRDKSGIVDFIIEDKSKIDYFSENKTYHIKNAQIMYKQLFQNEKISEILILTFNELTTIEEQVQFFKIFNQDSKKSNPQSSKSSILTSNDISETKCKDNMTYLNKIQLKKNGDFITTIGIITFIEEIKEIIPKSKNPIKIRNFYIQDQTTSNIKVAVWGKQAEDFDFKTDDIVIFSNIKISDFNGLTLSVQWSTSMMKVDKNWDHLDEVNKLRLWREECSPKTDI